MTETPAEIAVLGLTAQIVSAHVANNEVNTDALPGLIRAVYRALSNIDGAAEAEPVQHEPAVPADESVFPDYIICLEDGKQLKMLRRHLASVYNMTPEQYRQKWGLAPSYPMVAPSYAERRSELAKQIGLGTHRSAGG